MIMKIMANLLRIHVKFIDKVDELYATIDSKIGPKGDSPTREELLALIKPLIPEVYDGIDGIDGVDGHTPTEEELLSLIRPLMPVAKDGHTPTNEELIALITPLIPQAKDGATPIRGVDYLTEEDISTITEKVRNSITLPQHKDVTADDLLHLFTKGEKKLSVKHIDGLEQTLSAFSSQLGRGYLHGGGDTVKAGTNVTITTNSDGTKTIASTSSGGVGAWSTPPESPDGSNLIFSVSAEPTDVEADGLLQFSPAYYTYAGGQITFINPPTFSVHYR